MRCPICRKEVRFGDPYMPFCGERCKLIDLGNWAAEKYVIPGGPAGPRPGEDADEEPDAVDD